MKSAIMALPMFLAAAGVANAQAELLDPEYLGAQSNPPPQRQPYFAPQQRPRDVPPYAWRTPPYRPWYRRPQQRPLPPQHVRWLGVGMRYSLLGIRQNINGHGVRLGGLGAALRLRTSGRFAAEATVDFLHGRFPAGAARGGGESNTATNGSTSATGGYFHVGDVSRDSIPVAFSALVYLFRNRSAHILNPYLAGGLGFIKTNMRLSDEYGQRVVQRFTEFEAHFGGGLELRWRWLGLDAGVRGVRLWRDNNAGAAVYYRGVAGAPVPARSSAFTATLSGTIWF